MIKKWLKQNIAKFERRYSYDASYLHDIIEAKTSAGIKLAMTTGFLAEEFGAPANLVHAAKIRSTLRADCGPCLRLAITKAEEAGCAPEIIQTALGLADTSNEARTGADFADAILNNDPGLLEIIEGIRQHYGDNTLYALAVATNAGQFYPLLKRAMGHAANCEPVLRDYMMRIENGRIGESRIDDRAA